jgi:hypothetical protein
MSELPIGTYIVGLLNVSNNQVQPIGSGALVNFGKMAGVITAGHVWEKIEERRKDQNVEEIGFVHFPSRNNQLQGPRVRIDHLAAVSYPNKGEDDLGPDLAFIKLPVPTANALRANGSFFDFTRQQALALSAPPANTDQHDAVLGMVARWTQAPVDKGNLRSTTLQAIHNVGKAIPLEDGRNNFDRLLLSPEPESGFALPDSYGATSGGPLIRVFTESGTLNLVELRLLGIAYFETDKGDPVNNRIVCHGPRTLYNLLPKKIRERWPDEI